MTKDEALKNLVESVNSSRYRGVDRKGPMTNMYSWPRSFDQLEGIANSALQFVLAHEAEAVKTPETATPKTCSCQVYETCDICRADTEKRSCKGTEKEVPLSQEKNPMRKHIRQMMTD